MSSDLKGNGERGRKTVGDEFGKREKRWRLYNNCHQMLMGIPTAAEFQDLLTHTPPNQTHEDIFKPHNFLPFSLYNPTTTSLSLSVCLSLINPPTLLPPFSSPSHWRIRLLYPSPPPREILSPHCRKLERERKRERWWWCLCCGHFFFWGGGGEEEEIRDTQPEPIRDPNLVLCIL